MWQGWGEGSTALMAQNRQRGHNFAKLGLTAKKKICVCLFFVLMLHIKFQFLVSSRGSLVLQPTKGLTDRQTEAQSNMPPQLLQSWGHKKNWEGGRGLEREVQVRTGDVVCERS